jgi:hypothetical protein
MSNRRRKRKRKQRRKAISAYEYTNLELSWWGKRLTNVTDKGALAAPAAQTVTGIARGPISKGALVGVSDR